MSAPAAQPDLFAPAERVLRGFERSARADHYIAHMRALLADSWSQDRDSIVVHWWQEQMTVKDRRFMARVAKLDPAIAALPWLEVPLDQRALLLANFARLREWVNSFRAPLPKFREAP